MLRKEEYDIGDEFWKLSIKLGPVPGQGIVWASRGYGYPPRSYLQGMVCVLW